MRQLTIIRHAKSSWDDPGQPDFERPLNRRGRRDAPRMAEFLARQGPPPELLVTSPAVRARTTAGIFAEAWQYPREEIVEIAEIYEASFGALMAVVASLPDEIEHAAIFGHNPGFHELAARLADGRIDAFPTCAVADLVFPAEHWADLREGQGEVLRHVYPKLFQ